MKHQTPELMPVASAMLALAMAACSSPSPPPLDVAAEQAAIRAVYEKGCAGFAGGDMEIAMSPYSRDLFLFDIAPPYRSDYEHLKQANTTLRNAMATTPTCTYEEMVIEVIDANVAYAHYILPFSATLKSGAQLSIHGRGTDIFRKTANGWKIVHEHFSVPVDPFTGKAELQPPP
jgi:ketosteroid isomerase-like protein